VLLGLKSALANEAVYSPGGVAIQGYDVVSYHLKSKAGYSYHWNNTDWYYSSAENRNKFHPPRTMHLNMVVSVPMQPVKAH